MVELEFVGNVRQVPRAQAVIVSKTEWACWM